MIKLSTILQEIQIKQSGVGYIEALEFFGSLKGYDPKIAYAIQLSLEMGRKTDQFISEWLGELDDYERGIWINKVKNYTPRKMYNTKIN